MMLSDQTKPRSHATAAVLAGQMAWPDTLDGRFRLETEIMHTGSARLFRAYDLRLKTVAAVKLVAQPLVEPGGDETPPEHRFKHPYLVRLLDRGDYANGTWVAMEWVEGGTLLDLIRGHHRTDEYDLVTRPRGVDPSAPTTTGAPATMRQLLHLLSEAASGLGAAHAQGLVHLDLKPNNIMYESLDTPRERSARPMAWRAWVEDEQAFDMQPGGDAAPGDVLRVLIPRLIDWELSRRTGEQPPGEHEVLGVPSYLAPEYVKRAPVYPTADVYALGAILYHILSGRRPYAGIERRDVLDLLAADTPPAPLDVPPRLEPFADVCARAMAIEPGARYADGAAFCRALRRAQAECIFLRAEALRLRTIDLRERAEELRTRANEQLKAFGFCNAELKAPAWKLQDRADELEDEAYRYEARWAQQVRAVLAVDPGLAGGRASLIGWLTGRYRLAIRESRRRDAKLLLGELTTERKLFDDLRLDPVPEYLVPVIRDADDVLSNRAYLSLHTCPGARVEIAHTVIRGRRLELEAYESLGEGALERVPLTAGRLTLRVRADDRAEVIYPIEVVPGEHWALTPPGASAPIALDLPRADLAPDDVAFIAPGWCSLGGQRFAPDAPEGRRVWVDGFFIQKNPITHGEWLRFMRALAAEGKADEAWDRRPHVPMDSGTVPIYRRTADQFSCSMADLDEEHVARWPVSGITWHDAVAYARWRARKDGLPWRLPCEWEFEKASRCNDGRRLPWGEHMEATWTRIVGSTQETYRAVPVDHPTGDETVHGVRWTVGNVLTWCLDRFAFEGPRPDSRLVLPVPAVDADDPEVMRMMRGAAYRHPADLVSCSSRWASVPGRRTPACGVRLVRGFDPNSQTP